MFIALAVMGAYFEYLRTQNEAASYVQQLADLKTKQDQLTKDNEKLMDENAQLSHTLSVAQGHESDLTSQIKSVPTHATAPTTPAPAAAPSPSGQ